MSYTNGHTEHATTLREDSRTETIREEVCTDAEFQRACSAIDSHLALTRETTETFDWGGCKRVTVRILGRGNTAAALTYEAVPERFFFKEERSASLSLGAGSKVIVNGEECFLDRPILFKRRG